MKPLCEQIADQFEFGLRKTTHPVSEKTLYCLNDWVYGLTEDFTGRSALRFDTLCGKLIQDTEKHCDSHAEGWPTYVTEKRLYEISIIARWTKIVDFWCANDNFDKAVEIILDSLIPRETVFP